MDFCKVSVFIVLLFLLNFSDALEDEPVFSKLKYDKEMLETMVRMEARMKKWDKERIAFEENVLSILGHRREEMEELFSAQNGKIETMRDDLTNRTTHLEELAESLGNKPHVAFNAYINSSGIYPLNSVVIFPNVLLNEGNGYNNQTGCFTAPTAGLYHFSAHICQQLNYFTVVSISHGKREIARSTVFESDTGSCSSVSAPAIMNAGEQVSIKSIYFDSRLYGNEHRWPSFIGYLVTK